MKWLEWMQLTIIMGDARGRQSQMHLQQKLVFHEAISGQSIKLLHQYISNTFLQWIFSGKPGILWSADISVKYWKGGIFQRILRQHFLKFGAGFCFADATSKNIFINIILKVQTVFLKMPKIYNLEVKFRKFRAWNKFSDVASHTLWKPQHLSCKVALVKSLLWESFRFQSFFVTGNEDQLVLLLLFVLIKEE